MTQYFLILLDIIDNFLELIQICIIRDQNPIDIVNESLQYLPLFSWERLDLLSVEIIHNICKTTFELKSFFCSFRKWFILIWGIINLIKSDFRLIVRMLNRSFALCGLLCLISGIQSGLSRLCDSLHEAWVSFLLYFFILWLNRLVDCWGSSVSAKVYLRSRYLWCWRFP